MPKQYLRFLAHPGSAPDVSAKEIQRVAAKYFGEKKAFIVRVTPK